MKKTLAIAIALMMCLSVFANGSAESSAPASSAKAATKVGFVVINDESDQGYTWNFTNGMVAALDKLKAEGYNVELLTKKNTTESSLALDNNIELAEEGCAVVFNNSYGFENFALSVAKDYPDTQFVFMTNCGAQQDGQANSHNAFASIYEGRYVAGIAAGMKLQQEINEGKIKADEAVLGYVGAYSFAEVISGMSGFYLGAKSVCPSVTMKVYFVGTWGDATLEEAAANALIDAGCKLISQHSDTTSPALAAQKAGVYHVGYNTDMTKVAPSASLLSSRIDWTNYFYTFIKNVCDGKENPADFTGTLAAGDVKLTDLNTAIAAPGTQEAMDKAIAAFKAGTLNVFDTSKFTIDGGKQLTAAFAVDTNGDFAADSCEAVWDGVFHESYPEFQSAPYFTAVIDGIEWLNAAY